MVMEGSLREFLTPAAEIDPFHMEMDYYGSAMGRRAVWHLGRWLKAGKADLLTRGTDKSDEWR